MESNPLLGILLYLIGGFTGASFYLPFKKVKNWAWESYWAIYSLAGLVIVPWTLAFVKSPNVLSVLGQTPNETLFYCYLFGAMWGAGGLTWGLMIRYLGVGLGVAIGCGLCAAVGTLVPPYVNGDFAKLMGQTGGMAALVALLSGVGVSLAGIVATGGAGMSKEAEMSEEQKKIAVAEFNFPKGIVIAIFSGVMSAGMAFGVRAGDSISNLTRSIEPVTDPIWQGLPCLVVVLLGGFTVNFLWCIVLNLKNGTGEDYFKANTPLVRNVLLSALAGALWYSQMLFLTMGDSQVGEIKFSGWSVFMSAQIVFSTLWGIVLLEWKGCSTRTKLLLALGLVVLVASMAVIGYGNYLQEVSKRLSATPAA